MPSVIRRTSDRVDWSLADQHGAEGGADRDRGARGGDAAGPARGEGGGEAQAPACRA